MLSSVGICRWTWNWSYNWYPSHGGEDLRSSYADYSGCMDLRQSTRRVSSSIDRYMQPIHRIWSHTAAYWRNVCMQISRSRRWCNAQYWGVSTRRFGYDNKYSSNWKMGCICWSQLDWKNNYPSRWKRHSIHVHTHKLEEKERAGRNLLVSISLLWITAPTSLANCVFAFEKIQRPTTLFIH